VWAYLRGIGVDTRYYLPVFLQTQQSALEKATYDGYHLIRGMLSPWTNASATLERYSYRVANEYISLIVHGDQWGSADRSVL
jgi:hypothetical protein